MTPAVPDEASHDGLTTLITPASTSLSPQPQPPRYRAIVEAAIWRRWGDELAVYENRSAQTHLLVDGHAELFGLLAARPEPLTLRDIAREFEGGDGAPAQQALSDAELASLQSLVQELVALGLVEALSGSSPRS